MVPKERVLKFDRSDADSENTYVLLNAKSKGPKPLDLKLEAIDFESCFVHTLKHDKVGSLKVKNCPVSDAEWQNILEKLFDQKPQPEIHATASVSEGSIALVVRKSVEGITQRLGTITIPGTETQLNFLEWAGTAVDAVAEVKKTASDATAKVSQLEADVKELKSQLEELIQAKDEDEAAMLLKFRDLLNEKKVKIREQQKVLASASLKGGPSSSQPQQATQPPPPPSQTSLPSRGRKPQKSRSSKRKQPSPPAEEPSDDGLEQMEVDKIKEEEEETDKGAETDDTASTASDDDEGPARSASQANTATSSQQQSEQPKNTKGQPPPKRALPFVKNKLKPAAAAPAPTGDSETESDDEL